MTTKVVLGHTFTEMQPADAEIFAGAEDGTLICYTGGTVLLLCPDGSGGYNKIVEVDEGGTETTWVTWVTVRVEPGR